MAIDIYQAVTDRILEILDHRTKHHATSGSHAPQDQPDKNHLDVEPSNFGSPAKLTAGPEELCTKMGKRLDKHRSCTTSY